MLTPPEFGIFGQERALFSNAGMEFTANLLLQHPGLVVGGITNLSDCVPQPILNDRQHDNLRSVLNNARDKAKNKNANYAVFLAQVESDSFHRPTKITDTSAQNLVTVKSQMEQVVETKDVYVVENFVQRFLVDIENNTGPQLAQVSRSRLAHYILDDLMAAHDTSQLSTSERLKYLADYFLNRLRTGSLPLGLGVNRQQILTQTAESFLNLLGGVDKSQAPTTLLPEPRPTPPAISKQPAVRLPESQSPEIGKEGFASKLEIDTGRKGTLWSMGHDYAYKTLHIDDLFGTRGRGEVYGEVKKQRGSAVAPRVEWLGIYGALVKKMAVNHTPELSVAKVRLLTLSHIICTVGGLTSWQNIGAKYGYQNVLDLCDQAIGLLQSNWTALDQVKPTKGMTFDEFLYRNIYGVSADHYYSHNHLDVLIYKRYGVFFRNLGLTGQDLVIAEEISAKLL